MKDSTTKKSGPYHATSRAWEKAVKHRTVKMRRQSGKREIVREIEEAKDKRTIFCGASQVIDLEEHAQNELRKLWEDIEFIEASRDRELEEFYQGWLEWETND